MIGNSEAENALYNLLEEVDKDIHPYRVRNAEAQWKASITGNDEDFRLAQEAETALRLKLSNAEIFEEITKWLNDPGVQETELRRWGSLLRIEMAPNRLPEETILDLVTRQKKIENTYNSFRPEVSGKSLTQNEIANILRKSTDNDLKREAWEASKEIGPIIQEDIRELVKARNLAARSLGYPDYYRMSLELQEIDEARLFSSFGRFSDLSEDEFRRMKAKLDRLLADKFKVDAIDLAPWHYGDMFFQECPEVFDVNTESIFKGRNTLEWCEKYYQGMGLPINDLIEKGDYFEKIGKHPTAFCLDIDREGDIRVLMNLKDNPYWANTALHEFGHAVYDKNIDRSLPYTLRQTAHISITEAVAMFFDRLTYDIEWLIDMFGIPGSMIRELEKPMQEERRMTMAILSRWILVMVHFERGLYRDPDHDQQARWWDLVERFQLLRRPEKREELADWATKPHIALFPVYYHNYLLGEWIASQFHSTLVKEFNLREPVVWNDMPLVGSWFKKNLFSKGALISHNELIENITGSIPQPDAFIKQYFV